MVAVLALASLHVPNAGASTVAIQRANNVRLVYTAAADEANRGAVARAVDGAYLIEDLAAVIVPSSTGECTRVDDHHARCAAPDVQGVAVALGDLDDVFTVSDNAYPDTSPIGSPMPWGTGKDTLKGAAGADDLRGGADDDPLISGEGGPDSLAGGVGIDVVDGGPG